MSVQSHLHSNNGTEHHEDYMFTSFTALNYSNSSNGENINKNTDINKKFKISTRSIISFTKESKPSHSVELLGEFVFLLLTYSRIDDHIC